MEYFCCCGPLCTRARKRWTSLKRTAACTGWKRTTCTKSRARYAGRLQACTCSIRMKLRRCCDVAAVGPFLRIGYPDDSNIFPNVCKSARARPRFNGRPSLPCKCNAERGASYLSSSSCVCARDEHDGVDSMGAFSSSHAFSIHRCDDVSMQLFQPRCAFQLLLALQESSPSHLSFLSSLGSHSGVISYVHHGVLAFLASPSPTLGPSTRTWHNLLGFKILSLVACMH